MASLHQYFVSLLGDGVLKALLLDWLQKDFGLFLHLRLGQFNNLLFVALESVEQIIVLIVSERLVSLFLLAFFRLVVRLFDLRKNW